MPDIFLRVFARDSQTNDPIASPNVNGTIGIIAPDGSITPIAVNSSGHVLRIPHGDPLPPGFDYTVQLSSKSRIKLGPLPRNGIYQVYFWRDGYENTTQNLTVEATMPNEQVDKYVIMSPTLGPEETRIIYTWQEDDPEDVDLYVVAIKKDDDTICKVHYDNRQCPGVTLDRCVNSFTNLHTTYILHLLYFYYAYIFQG